MCESGLHEHEAAVCETAAGFTTVDSSCFLLCFSALTGRAGDEGVLLEGRGQFWALSWDWKLISCFISLRDPQATGRREMVSRQTWRLVAGASYYSTPCSALMQLLTETDLMMKLMLNR
jgi:hypothetical protein